MAGCYRNDRPDAPEYAKDQIGAFCNIFAVINLRPQASSFMMRVREHILRFRFGQTPDALQRVVGSDLRRCTPNQQASSLAVSSLASNSEWCCFRFDIVDVLRVKDQQTTNRNLCKRPNFRGVTHSAQIWRSFGAASASIKGDMRTNQYAAMQSFIQIRVSSSERYICQRIF